MRVGFNTDKTIATAPAAGARSLWISARRNPIEARPRLSRGFWLTRVSLTSADGGSSGRSEDVLLHFLRGLCVGDAVLLGVLSAAL